MGFCFFKKEVTHYTTVFIIVVILVYLQMLEMFEKDDTDVQTSSSDFVPIAQYESLRKEYEELQERFSKAQASDDTTSMAEEQ